MLSDDWCEEGDKFAAGESWLDKCSSHAGDLEGGTGEEKHPWCGGRYRLAGASGMQGQRSSKGAASPARLSITP